MEIKNRLQHCELPNLILRRIVAGGIRITGADLLCKENGARHRYHRDQITELSQTYAPIHARKAMRRRMIAARTLLGLSSQLMATLVFAQQMEEILANTNIAEAMLQPTYMVKGQPVKLLPSELYGAFAVPANDLQEFEVEVAQTGALAVERSGLTDGYGIALTRRLASATDEGFSDAIAALETKNESYVVFGGGVGEKVLINEFIVRFSSDVSDQEAQTQLRKIGAEVLGKAG